MFTDESAKDGRTHIRQYGRAYRGTQCCQRTHFIRGVRYSILPVLTLDGIITYDIIQGSVSSERFVQFLRQYVVRPVDLIFGNSGSIIFRSPSPILILDPTASWSLITVISTIPLRSAN
jgi:hypothetical protein